MESINNDDNDGGEQEAQAEQIARSQHQRQRKQERQRKFKKVNSILKKHGKFPVQNRNSIDELVDRFLEEVEDSVHDLLCNNHVDADNYRGLDSDRDTEAEVETAIRCFPDVLSRRDDRFDEYPIRILHCLRLHTGADRICNLKAVSFIPIVARLAVEFGLFEEKERGGLLLEEDEGEDNRNTLQLLWDPNALTHPTTFKAGMFFFPKKKGINLLFQKDTIGRTPYKIACASYDQLFQKNTFHTPFYGSYASYGVHYASKNKGRDAVMEVIESTLSNCSDKPDNFVDAFLSAAVDKGISLDCVYFLLRRDPDMLHKLRLDSTLD
ncbi:hypothetical protein FRACYDRAFT_251839 [Fragilariopsis cylindrus CCMP1102]|uniref:Uncharacterized protein n=1 Tax=Fragilariopsis cylindrus CCMP1102 TaxID=635003 RepID=A0A1E7EMI1_9STRA|nr:hypothetical protein FRACYDRAFT_251839 [Fragilariopsis cylindrus CCMP1102]|eukprot:OEU07105.1 hypothetical protein FRACYDRAFT_251839 [Fragilariopsis cylindrus CCMP1102]